MNQFVSTFSPFLGYIHFAYLVLSGTAAASGLWYCQAVAAVMYSLILLCSDFRSKTIEKSLLIAASLALIPCVHFVDYHVALMAFLIIEYFYSSVVFKHTKK